MQVGDKVVKSLGVYLIDYMVLQDLATRLITAYLQESQPEVNDKGLIIYAAARAHQILMRTEDSFMSTYVRGLQQFVQGRRGEAVRLADTLVAASGSADQALGFQPGSLASIRSAITGIESLLPREVKAYLVEYATANLKARAAANTVFIYEPSLFFDEIHERLKISNRVFMPTVSIKKSEEVLAGASTELKNPSLASKTSQGVDEVVIGYLEHIRMEAKSGKGLLLDPHGNVIGRSVEGKPFGEFLEAYHLPFDPGIALVLFHQQEPNSFTTGYSYYIGRMTSDKLLLPKPLNIIFGNR